MSTKQHSDRRVAYLASLSLLFSALELFIPKPLPFFKLGLANIPIMLSLSLPAKSFIELIILKAVASSYISGTLFSPFLAISLMQSLGSALIMRWVKKAANDHISLYGVSLIGAECSSLIQLSLASLYIGRGVWNYMPLMLIVSLFASIATAYIALAINIEKTPSLNQNEKEDDESNNSATYLTIGAISIFLTKDIYSALAVFALTLIMQKLSLRKIRIAPYISIIFFMALSALFTPEGKVLFSIGNIRLTDEALKSAMIKALHLTSSVALSQSYITEIRFKGKTITLVVEYFYALLSSFKKTSGKLRDRVNELLSLDFLESERSEKKNNNTLLIKCFTVVLVLISISSFLYFYFFSR